MKVANQEALGQASPDGMHLACGEYPWMVFYEREKRDFRNALDSGLGEIAASGFDGYEPLVSTAAEIEQLGPLLWKHSLEMRSLYVNSVLHDAASADNSIDLVLAIAEKAKVLGTKLIVTNPSPIRWGGPENKDDGQLEVQASALNRLGAELKKSGQILAYHNHDIELREAARELHHMLTGTDPDMVTFCMDAHWIYRGAGNSSVALFDILKLYGSRTTELHIRQSVDNVWSESFGEGDIDYPRLIEGFLSIGKRPHLVMEQAVEKGSPHTMNALEAHRKSVQRARHLEESHLLNSDLSPSCHGGTTG
jgi:inosose dehydratase